MLRLLWLKFLIFSYSSQILKECQLNIGIVEKKDNRGEYSPEKTNLQM